MFRCLLDRTLVLAAVAALAIVTPVSAQSQLPDDGGMWPYDNLPLGHLKAKYGFEPDQAWIDKLRLASVRVSTGGSGSFVSPDGLVLTNHHVALELINALSTPERDLVTNGFHARTQAEELKCEGAELVQLKTIKDVTAEVQAAGADADDAASAAAARRAKIAEIQERESQAQGLQVEVVTLYGGGQYAAYGYRAYKDVRLVFAPEMRAAYYGGDLDNFTYPRYCLDMTFLRAYEDGEPIDSSSHFFKWNAAGPKEDELTFVSGNPGRTSRLWPLARKQHDRDAYNPLVLALLDGRERALSAYASQGEDQRLEVLDELFGVRNSQKAFQGMLDGLRNPVIWDRLAAMDASFREDAKGDAAVEKALATYDETLIVRNRVIGDLILCRIEGGLGAMANQLNAMAAEVRAVGESVPAPLKARLDALRSAEVNVALETERLAGGFHAARGGMGEDDEFLAMVFRAGETPHDAARRLLKESALADASRRAALIDRILKGEDVSGDPLLALASLVAPRRAAAGQAWQQSAAREEEAGAALARARFGLYGKAQYPDATFTLRVSIGVGKRYSLGTTVVPWITTLAGLYERHRALGGKEPFDLPERWLKARERMDLDVPYNFVSTHDIIGGNSGSPVVNKNLELVGLVFDGNIQSLPNNYLYLDEVCRSVSVHSAGMTHTLEVVYKAYGLLAELGLR